MIQIIAPKTWIYIYKYIQCELVLQNIVIKKEYSYFHTKVVIIDQDFVKLLFSKTDKVTNIEHVTMQEDNEYSLYLSSYSLS